VAGIIPWIISRIPAVEIFSSLFSLALFAIGGGILVAATISFYRRGRGTLAPWDPPRLLVVSDLYRFNRNPMYVGVSLLNLGWALFTGNPWNYGYAIIVALVFHLRVVLYEEKEMDRLFGSRWKAYRDAVPRWGLCLRPYVPDFASGAGSNGSPAKPLGDSRNGEGPPRRPG